MKKIIISKNELLLAYKLLHDLLSLLLLTFAGILIAEGLLPGLISSKIGIGKLMIFIIIVLATIAWLGKNLDLTYAKIKINKNKILPPVILLSFLLIGNSLLKFTLWENLIITLATLFIFFLIYEIICHKEK